MNDFVPEAPEVEGATTPKPADKSEDATKPDGAGGTVRAWADCENLLQLYNNGYTYYKSSTRNANGQFEYTLEVKDEAKIDFKGKDANGNDISRIYDIGANGNKKYRDIKGTGAELRFGSENNVDEKHIEFKPAGMNSYIKLYLAEKPKN